MKPSISQYRDGFHILVKEFALPAESWNLDPQSKRAVTICNLFVNHQYGISDVVRVLDEDRRNIVHVLIEKGIIKDGRVRQMRPPQGIERRTSNISPEKTLWTPEQQY